MPLPALVALALAAAPPGPAAPEPASLAIDGRAVQVPACQSTPYPGGAGIACALVFDLPGGP